MRNANMNNCNGGLPAVTVVGLVFIVLKLVGLIDWSWIWVLCPFWIGFALATACMVGLTIYAFFRRW